jgi:N-acetylglucosaminyl-diphospho-decaprenol L-rhamnosyltransferase
MTRLAVIIVSYNSRKDLGTALRSLTEPPPAVAHEIVVVDNASTDSTPAYVREQWRRVRLIASESNLGFAQANNVGIRNTASELVLLLNPDTIMTAAAVDRLVSIMDSRSDVAIVGPRIVDGTGRAELSFGAMISPWAEFRQKLLVRGNDRRLPVITGLVDRMTRRTHLVDWVSGACLLIRRQDLNEVGGFDPRFFMYAEDVDLCAAVRARGKSVLFSAEPQVVHLRGKSAASHPARVQDAYRRSQIAFYAKHHPAWLPFLKIYLKIAGRLPDSLT